MGFELKKVVDVVDAAVNHKWGIPEFQRGFVWNRQKVRDLVDSLWRGYPVGSFLLWYAPEDVESRVVADGVQSAGWLVDGQQRATALCVLFGRKPYWWESGWNTLVDGHDIRFNVLAEDDPFFQLASSAIKRAPEWVKVRSVLVASDDALSEIVQDLTSQLGLSPGAFGKLYTRLDKVRQIRAIDLPVVTVTLDLEDVTEVFSRLNSAGTKVTEADIALALAASQNPGWARETFLPFLRTLDDAGFEVDPNLVFRSMLAIGLGKAILRDVPRSYWASEGLGQAWTHTKAAWEQSVLYIEERGILSADVMPTKNALIPLVVLVHKHSSALHDGRAFAWFLHATRAGRYGGSAITAVQADVRTIIEAESLDAAIVGLHAKLLPWEPFQAADFLSSYRDRVLRLFLYLVMFDRKARDWITAQPLGFSGQELLEKFNPQWHHIFPRGYLGSQNVQEERWDLFANIAVLAPTTNMRIGAKSPPEYLERYAIPDARLGEQLIDPAPEMLVIGAYEAFLAGRAQRLADAANAYMTSLTDWALVSPSSTTQTSAG